jgi:hypothetical protein
MRFSDCTWGTLKWLQQVRIVRQALSGNVFPTIASLILHGKKNIIFKFRGSDHDILWFARPILPFQNDNFIQNVA